VFLAYSEDNVTAGAQSSQHVSEAAGWQQVGAKVTSAGY